MGGGGCDKTTRSGRGDERLMCEGRCGSRAQQAWWSARGRGGRIETWGGVGWGESSSEKEREGNRDLSKK